MFLVYLVREYCQYRSKDNIIIVLLENREEIGLVQECNMKKATMDKSGKNIFLLFFQCESRVEDILLLKYYT